MKKDSASLEDAPLTPKSPAENEETWETIPIFKCQYQASSRGRLRNKHFHILKTHRENNQLKNTIMLSVGDKTFDGTRLRRKMDVAFLVASAFLPNPGYTHVLNTKAPYTDDSPENLKWVDEADYKAFFGEQRAKNASNLATPHQRLTPEDVRQIRALEVPAKHVAKRFNISTVTVRSIRARRTWKYLR